MRTQTVQDADGSRAVYVYDDASRHVRTTDYNAAGTATCDIVYDHTPDGEVSGWTVSRPPGRLFKRFERKPLGNGLAEIRQFNAAGQLELLSREEAGEPEGRPRDLLDYASPSTSPYSSSKFIAGVLGTIICLPVVLCFLIGVLVNIPSWRVCAACAFWMGLGFAGLWISVRQARANLPPNF